MCTECGEFRPATVEGDSLVPVREDCPYCGSTAYADPSEESGDS